ncbi:MAG: CPBP family intramembrane glutamic endopeptidase [Pirellulaceae bacterium]
MSEQPFAILLLGITLVTWSTLCFRRQPGQPWVAYEPRRPVPWGLVDVLLALGLLIVFSSLALTVVGVGPQEESPAIPTIQEPDFRAPAIYAQAAVSLAVVLVSVLSIVGRYRAEGRELGWVVSKIGSDVRLGVVAFLALAPPVYALQLLLVQWFKSHHPLVEMLRKDPQPHLIVACIVSAVVVAPVAEEYLFRGLLQGWFERLATGRDRSQELLVGGRTDALDVREVGESPAEKSASNRSSSDQCVSPALGVIEPLQDSEQAVGAAYWPMAVSALIFAVLHLSHGPDWIPLFFLALGLGYLYRQTHRILPSIVVHFLLNACSIVMFLVEVFFPNMAVLGTPSLF